MKKLNILILALMLSVNSLAFAQEDAPPDFTDLLQNINFGEEPPEQPAADPAAGAADPGAGAAAGNQSNPTSQSNDFDLGGLDSFNEIPSQQQQQLSPAVFVPASAPVQQFAPAPTMLQGNLLPAIQPIAQTYVPAPQPPRVAQTGPGALAALIPVAGYTLFTFRRKD